MRFETIKNYVEKADLTKHIPWFVIQLRIKPENAAFLLYKWLETIPDTDVKCKDQLKLILRWRTQPSWSVLPASEDSML
jgi:hypothetical protein